MLLMKSQNKTCMFFLHYSYFFPKIAIDRPFLQHLFMDLPVSISLLEGLEDLMVFLD